MGQRMRLEVIRQCSGNDNEAPRPVRPKMYLGNCGSFYKKCGRKDYTLLMVQSDGHLRAVRGKGNRASPHLVA